MQETFAEMLEHKGTHFANARDVRNYFEKIITRQATRIANNNSSDKSMMTTITEADEEVMRIGLHRCGNKIRYTDYKGTKSAQAKKFNVRKQVNSYVQQILEKWDVGMVFYGTGNPDKPMLTEKCTLPFCWEKSNI
jgi:hypothetical protein